MDQRVEQGIDAREDVDARVLPHQLDEGAEILRIGHQNIQSALAQPHQPARREREDVVERQRAQEDKLADRVARKRGLKPRVDLHDIGQDVPVQ